MEIEIKNLDEKWYEHRQFPIGYGHFPYLIFKTGHAMFMQIPIHFNTKGDFDTYPGANIEGISEHELDEYKVDKSSPLHDKIMDKCKWIKNKIETDKNKPCKICLVEGPNTAYYFEEDKITFSHTPPYGGTLLTQQNKVIAMNMQHYL
jgi:hypothetical protein